MNSCARYQAKKREPWELNGGPDGWELKRRNAVRPARYKSPSKRMSEK